MVFSQLFLFSRYIVVAHGPKHRKNANTKAVKTVKAYIQQINLSLKAAIGDFAVNEMEEHPTDAIPTSRA